MAIMRWHADADTTITNAFKEGLSLKGSASNMGLADSLEVFCLHGQVANSGTDSKEIARILIRFDVEKLRESLVSGAVPNPGQANKPKYFLRLFNAPHPETLPRNFTLHVHSLASAFVEGSGLDMSEYKDAGAASWLYRNDTPTSSGSGSITVGSNPTNGENFSIRIDTATINVTAGATAALTATAIFNAINAQTDIVSATDPSGSTTVAIQATTVGSVGNYRYFITANSGGITTADSYLTGGLDFTPWTANGGTAMGINVGDYAGTGSVLPGDALAVQTFETGEEDMMLDLTTHIESIIWDGSALRSLNDMKTRHNGFLIKVKDESLKETTYTKKFFARSSEFFFKRPVVEARWDSSVKDNRANFFTKSAVSSANTQNIYLYNSENGVRTDFTLPGGTNIFVRFYTDSAYSTLATLDPSAAFVQATSVAGLTGVYSAAVVIDDSTATKIYDKWYAATAGDADSGTWTVVHSGSFSVSQRSSSASAKKDRYIFDITNLKNSYSRTEKPRFRLYTRLKDWSPTIYTKAKDSLENKVVDKVYYKVFRVVDDEVVVDYGIGSSGTNNEHSLLSYDSEGSYFDFDMSLLESGYMYGLRFMTSIDGELKEQREVFKFRVD